MYWYEQYSPGRLAMTAVAATLGFYLFGFVGPAPTGPVAAFFVTITGLYFAWSWLGPLIDEFVLFPGRRPLLRGLREASAFADELRRVLAKLGGKLGDEARNALDAEILRLDSAVEKRDPDGLLAALKQADRCAEQYLGSGKKGILRDFFESIGGALMIALLLRVFVVEAFKIPSGSMIPTLEIGDHIFVNKFSFGMAIPTLHGQIKLIDFGTPKPGDVIVFVAPEPADNAGEDFIKRVVAVGGQRVSLRDGTVYVDGVAQPRSEPEPYSYEEYVEELGVGQRFHAMRYRERTGTAEHHVLLTYLNNNSWPTDEPQRGKGLRCDAEACEVLPGYVFCMGDNRDNSSDSRRWGAVPLDNVKGKAMFVWLSFANSPSEHATLGIRWGRTGTWIR